MITDYIGGEGSAETPKNDYVIYGWPLRPKHFRASIKHKQSVKDVRHELLIYLTKRVVLECMEQYLPSKPFYHFMKETDANVKSGRICNLPHRNTNDFHLILRLPIWQTSIVDWATDFKTKNTKNWYTIDALGAIFAIFTIIDTFIKLLQYFNNTFAILL